MPIPATKRRSRPRVTRIWWERGSRDGSFVPALHHRDRDHQAFAVYTSGAVEIYFYWYTYKPPFDAEEKRLDLLRRINEATGAGLPDDSIERRPSLSLASLTDPGVLGRFLAVFDWYLAEVRKS